MTLLSEALARISIVLKQQFPLSARWLTPGLTRAEIDSALSTLLQSQSHHLPEEVYELYHALLQSHCLPEEVYELYQWSGGQDYGESHMFANFFYGFSLLSLPRALNAIGALEDPSIEVLSARYIGKPLFPLFGTDKQFLCVVMQPDRTVSCPLIDVSEIKESTIGYSSLTSMMLTFAECFESGVMISDEDGFIDYSTDEFWRIHRKHNANLLELSLDRLGQELTLFGNRVGMEELSCKALEEFRSQVDFLRYFWGEVEANQIPSHLLAPLIAATHSEDEDVKELAGELLEYIHYVG